MITKMLPLLPTNPTPEQMQAYWETLGREDAQDRKWFWFAMGAVALLVLSVSVHIVVTLTQ